MVPAPSPFARPRSSPPPRPSSRHAHTANEPCVHDTWQSVSVSVGYARTLTRLVSTPRPSERIALLTDLHQQLSHEQSTPENIPSVATFTAHALSTLFSRDAASARDTARRWSHHPAHSETTLLAILRVLCTALCHPLPAADVPLELPTIPTRPQLVDAFAAAPRTLALSTAYLLNVLTALCEEDAIPLRRAGFHAIAALIHVLPASSVAAFLPGLASVLTRSLVDAARLHSRVVIAALVALHALLSTTFGPRHPDRTPVPDPPAVLRDNAWLDDASANLGPRLHRVFVSPHAALHHPVVRVRQQLAAFLSALFRYPTLVLPPDTRALVRVSLIALAGDDFSAVRRSAHHACRALSEHRLVSSDDFHRGLRQVVALRSPSHASPWHPTPDSQRAAHLDRLREHDRAALAALVDPHPHVWALVATGYLTLIFHPVNRDQPHQHDQRDDQVKQDHPSGITADLASTVTIVAPDAICALLIELLADRWAVAEDSTDAFNAALDHEVLRAATLLGSHGLLGSVFSSLVGSASVAPDADDLETTFKHRAFAVLVLQAVLRGAICTRNENFEDTSESHAHYRRVYECAKETLHAMTGFFLPASGTSPSRVDDSMITLKHCLLVATAHIFHDLSELHARARLRPLGADITLVVLMGLLRDVSNGEVAVRQTARDTMVAVSRTIGGKSERRLLLRHLNYIIGRVIRNIDQRWAGDVLAFVIGTEGDDVSREATVLLEGTLRHMNENLAGASDERALITINSIINVLSTAVAQKQTDQQGKEDALPSLQQDSLLQTSDIGYENELKDLRKTLFAYCADDISDYETLTGRTDPSSDPFQGDEEADENASRPAFETVAIHALEGTRDILVGRPWNICAASLLCATLAVKLLEGRRRVLLPFAAKILPLLPDQFVVLNEQLNAGERLLRDFRTRKLGGRENGDDVEDLVTFLNSKGKELPVVTNACLLLAAFAAYAGSFIRDRFVRLIYPKMRRLLRLAQCFPTLLVSSRALPSTALATMPSYGAMSASDACLEALSSVAIFAPDVLAPFANSLTRYLSVYFDPKFDPATSPKRLVVHTNRSMVRFECERWAKRVSFAETIIRQLKTVNASDVLTSFLKYDESVPISIAPGHPDMKTFIVRASRENMDRTPFRRQEFKLTRK